MYINKIYMYMLYISHLLYPLSVNGHLGSFHILAIVSNAAKNMREHMSL